MISKTVRKFFDSTTLRLGIASLLVVSGILMLTHQSSSASLVGIKVDLISGHDWNHFAGTTVNGTKLDIKPLNRAIVNQDGTFGQYNPPVNIRGPYLKYSGDILLNYNISNISDSDGSILDVYGSVPGIYDEWRYEKPRARLSVYSTNAKLEYWDGTSSNPSGSQNWTISSGSSAAVSLTRKKDALLISVNGQQLGQINSKELFKSGQLWFGADASNGSSGWTLNSLSVTPQKGSRLQVIDNNITPTAVNTQSLRYLAQKNPRHLPIGAALSSYVLFSDPVYSKVAATQFSMLTPENELKPQFVHPSPGVYSFTDADSLVEFAQANGMMVHGHTLVFSEANPLWMQNSPLNQRQSIMSDHITTVVGHYKNQINEWDVVNEPLSDDEQDYGNASDLRNNIWEQAMGEQYIDTAFISARSANPNAKLYINEYGLEADGPRWDEFIKLLQRLQARQVPIDGVGFQAHVYEPGDEIDPLILQKHMKQLSAMGLSSRISEIDVYGDNPVLQGNQYSAALSACLNSPTCSSFSTWGITDKYGSTTETGAYPLELGNDLLWNSRLQPKSAQRQLAQQLKK